MPGLILYAGFWKYFQRFTVCSFVFLAGVSLAIGYQRRPKFSRFLRRGLQIFACGLLFSFAVWLFQIGYVHFGVLHMIDVSTILAYPLLRYQWLNVSLWLIFYVVGGIFLLPKQVTWWLYLLPDDLLSKLPIQVDTLWLVWLGLAPPRYYPVDFFPLFPYFGLILLGVGVGNLLYNKNGRGFNIPDRSELAAVRFLRFLGAYSLSIYMLHQPVLIAILLLLDLAP